MFYGPALVYLLVTLAIHTISNHFHQQHSSKHLLWLGILIVQLSHLYIIIGKTLGPTRLPSVFSMIAFPDLFHVDHCSAAYNPALDFGAELPA